MYIYIYNIIYTALYDFGNSYNSVYSYYQAPRLFGGGGGPERPEVSRRGFIANMKTLLNTTMYR